jgi:hypothetical protein
MDSVIRRSFLTALIVALAACLAVPATAIAGKTATHEPPYKKGNSGGDQFNYVNADPQSGQVTLLRLFPGVPPVVGCAPEPAAGWATLTQKHDTSGAIDKVIVNFEGFLEPYAWVYATVRDSKGDAIGLRKLQGPHAGAGSLKVDIFKQPKKGSTIEIEFGAQLGDACPQVGGADVTFSSIKIN